MAIRAAESKDISAIYEVALEAHAKSNYKNVPVDEKTLRQLILMMIYDKNSCVYVTEDAVGVNGFVLGMVEELFFSRKRYGTDLMIYARKPMDGVRLLRKLTEWIKTKPRDVEITLGITSGIGDPERTGKLYEAMGYEPIGGMYMMNLMESKS